MQKLYKSVCIPKDGRIRRLQKLERHGQGIKKDIEIMIFIRWS